LLCGAAAISNARLGTNLDRLKTPLIRKSDKTEIDAPATVPGRVSLMMHTLGLVSIALGGAVLGAFLLDLVGLEVRPWTVGPLILGLLGLALWNFRRLVRREKYAGGGYDLGEFAAFGLVTLGFLVYALWLGRPGLLPVGTTVDAVHQYGLADYITQSGHLPIHATAQRANLQDGLAYPPAFVTIVALLAQISGLDPVYLLYPVAAFCAALATGATFAVVSFMLRGRAWRLLLAGLTAGFTLIPYGYTFGSFTSQNYFAQVCGQAFLMLALFFLVDWQRNRGSAALGLFGLTVAALVICYPTFALIPLAAFGAVALVWPGQSWRGRLTYLAGVLIPSGLLAILFLKDRLATGLGTVGNEGEVLLPDLGRYSWPVVGLAAFGLGVTLWKGQAGPRLVALYAGLLALEGLGLWLLKVVFNQGSHYAIYKLFYPAVYLLALLALLGLDWVLSEETSPLRLRRGLGGEAAPLRLGLILALVGIDLFGIFLGVTWWVHPTPERSFAVITEDNLKVARWMKANLKIDEYSVGYNVPPGTPAYWLQVGLFKQPQGVRTDDLLNRLPLTFESWFYTPDSNRYLFTDNLAKINLDERVQVLYQSGSVAVLTRTPAYEQEFGVRPGLTIQYKSELKNGYVEFRAEATMTTEPQSWLKVGLEIEPAGGGQPLFSAFVPAEKGRDRAQYLGVVVGVPNLKISEYYANNYFPERPPQGSPLGVGRFAAFMTLQKQGATLLRQKLFEFTHEGEGVFKMDYGAGLSFGQLLFEGSLPQTLPAVTPLDFVVDGANFKLTGVDLPEKGQAGATVQAGVEWQLAASVTRSYRLRWAWLDADGQVAAETEAVPLNDLYPTWLWSAGQPIAVRQGLKLPDKPGRYQLALAWQDTTPAELKKLDKFIVVG
jgi:hypothetical protein